MEIISTKTLKAIKEHNCNYCWGKIKIGEKYQKTFLKEDYAYIWTNHFHCQNIAEKLNMFDDGPITEDDFENKILSEYQNIRSQEIDESEDFKYPDFHEQLDFVLSYHNIKKDGSK